jgi:hypothetical protein
MAPVVSMLQFYSGFGLASEPAQQSTGALTSTDAYHFAVAVIVYPVQLLPTLENAVRGRLRAYDSMGRSSNL